MHTLSVLALLLTAAAVGIFGASGTITRLIKRSYRSYRTVLLALRAGGLVALGFGIAGAALDSRLLLLTSAGVLVFGLMLAVVATVFERIAPSAPLNQESILIVAAHPDDLEIACGATTAKLIDQGYSVHALILADGKDGGEVAGRAGEATNGAEFLGLASLTMLALPDRALDQNMKEMIAAIEAEIEKYQPTLIFTHSIHDVHQDHVAVHKAVVRAGRNHHSILCFESPSVTADFRPTVFMDVTDYAGVKAEAIAAHISQRNKQYLTRNVTDSTLKFRGRQGRIPEAEGFEAVRFHLAAPRALKQIEVANEISR